MRRHAKLPKSAALTQALRHPTFEVVPLKGVDEAVAGLPREVRLTVTCTAARGVDRTVEVAGQLSEMGFRVAPHLAARTFTGEGHLADVAARLEKYGIREVFVIGGDRDEPAGCFDSAAALLGALAAQGVRFDEVGVAGYPEPHPTIPEAGILKALESKSRYATYISTQLCFAAPAIRAWAGGLRSRGITLPVDVGVAGAVQPARLMRMSAKIGVGQSLRFLRSNRGLAAALLGQPGSYRPDRLLSQLEPAFADPDSPVRGLHIYTFNVVARTEEWRQAALEKVAQDARPGY